MRSRYVVTAGILAACAEGPAPVDVTPAWSLTPAPAISIGRVDGDERYTFRRLVGATLLPDGGVMVADVEPAMTIYDSAGAFVRRFGRKGTGPGEFQLLWAAPFEYRGDSIAVWDLSLRRVSVFTPEGTFGRSATVVVPKRHWPPGTVPEQSCCNVRTALSNGDFVLEFPGTIPNQPGSNRHSTVTLAKVVPDGSTGDTIGDFVSMLYRYDATAPSAVRDLHIGGRFTYVVVGDTVFGGNGESPWLLRRVPGSGLDTIRLPIARVPVTQAIKDAYANAWRAEFARHPEKFEGPAEELFEGEYATHLPAYTQVLHDGAGHLWLGQWKLPFGSDSTRFDVYSTRGQPVARVLIPPHARIADIRNGRVALIEADSLGVEYVRVYGVARSRGQSR